MTETMAPVRHAELSDIDELVRLRAYLLDGEDHASSADGGAGAAALPYTAATPEARAAWRAGYRAWLARTLPHDPDVCVAVAPGPGRLRACAIAVIDRRPPSPAYPSGRVAWMQSLVTDPRDRGHGLGTAVIDHLFDCALTRGADVAVMQSASGAVDFHRRAGWLPTGEGLYHQPVTPNRKA
ncbi:GNAT family N-acetyltransferase [Streptomyces sp. NPDC056670]|uniref:GNAT family N-acetyltransferase n=1 Tax=unclassified Streptomyces TaxID=2593676 RepID=UPI00368A59B9